MYKELVEKKQKLAIIGMGYVGLPLALEFAKKISVIGFDKNPRRVEMLRDRIDPSQEMPQEKFDDCDIVFTDSLDILKEATVYIVTVPTPVDSHNLPDLQYVFGAANTIGQVLKKGDYVIFESTVYPGCTEEECLPIVESVSGLKLGTDFKLCHSPERINPGDKVHTTTNIVKLVSASDEEALEEIAKLYELVITAGVHRTSSIKIAEASKIIENTQRDINIGFMNELSIIFDMMDINTYEVLDAAKTKWNFLNFQPGLVGGHCVGVDPYYLIYKSAAIGYESKVISSSRTINNDMAKHVARNVITHVLRHSSEPKVLIKGVTFKENVIDIRNSKIVDTVKELLLYNIHVDVEDPYAEGDQVEKVYGLKLVPEVANDYDAVIITHPHKDYLNLHEDYFVSITKESGLIYDLKAIYRNKITKRKYATL